MTESAGPLSLQYDPFWAYCKRVLSPELELLATHRGYSSDHPFFSNPPDLLYFPEGYEPIRELLNVPEFMLEGRWVTPIRYPDSSIATLVGWRPTRSGQGRMKYLTLPEPTYSKSHILLGAHSILTTPTHFFVVEGVFDYLALTSLGIPAVSLQGKTASPYHKAQYRLLGIPHGVPDRDSPEVIHKDAWGTKRYLTWDFSIPGKDCDDLVRSLPTSHTYELFQSAAQSDDLVTKVSAL